MQWNNSHERFGIVAMALHWAIGLSMIALIGLGLYMTSLPNGDAKWSLYSLHKSIGMLVFLLVIVRVGWRLRSVVPPLPDGLKAIEAILAHLTHGLLYLTMVLLPFSGYVDSSAGDYKLKFFGWFDVPKLIPKDKLIEDISVLVHETFAYLLIVLLLLHVGAVLKHHFILKDNVLRRMLP